MTKYLKALAAVGLGITISMLLIMQFDLKSKTKKPHDIIAIVQIINDLGIVTEEIPVTNFAFDNDSLMFEIEYLKEGIDTPIVVRQWAPKKHVRIDALIRK